MTTEERMAREIAAWVRAEAENKDYAAACEWRNVADAIEKQAEDTLWLCGDCNALNGMHEAFCYGCGAGPPEAAAFDEQAPASAAASAPTQQPDPAGGETARFTTEEPR